MKSNPDEPESGILQKHNNNVTTSLFKRSGWGMSSALLNNGLIINQKHLSGIGEDFVDKIRTRMNWN
jgi:hypothetical protein